MYSVVEEEEEEYDCLYTVMVDIVTAHNMFIESIHTRIHARTLSTVSGLLTDQPTNVLLTEVNNHDCLFGDFTRWLTLTDTSDTFLMENRLP